MAFTSELTVNGRVYAAAYVRVKQSTTARSSTLVELEAWESSVERSAGLPSLQWAECSHRYDTLADTTCTNPIDYAYQLLEASGMFPTATWNV